MKSDKITSRTVSLKSLERPLYLKFCFSFFSSIGNKSTLTIAVMFTDQMCTLSKSCSCAGRKSVVTKVFGHIEPNWWKHGYFFGFTGCESWWIELLLNLERFFFLFATNFTILKQNLRWIVSRSICKCKHKSKQWIWFRLKRSTRTRNHSTSSHLLRLCYLNFVRKKISSWVHSQPVSQKKRTHAMHTLLNTLFEWFMFFFRVRVKNAQPFLFQCVCVCVQFGTKGKRVDLVKNNHHVTLR